MRSEKIRRSRKQERVGMAQRGGVVHRGSGNGWARKADGHTSFELVEFKRTDKRQITLKASDLEAVCTHAVLEGHVPVLEIELAGRSYVMVPREDWLEQTACGGSWDDDGGT